MPAEPAAPATPDVDLAALPKTPKIDEAGYAWIGRLGPCHCLLMGDRELTFDKTLKTSVFDSRTWSDKRFSKLQERKRVNFINLALSYDSHVLFYIYTDIGEDLTSEGEHMAKRGPRKFTGLFRIAERGEDWFLALLERRV